MEAVIGAMRAEAPVYAPTLRRSLAEFYVQPLGDDARTQFARIESELVERAQIIRRMDMLIAAHTSLVRRIDGNEQ